MTEEQPRPILGFLWPRPDSSAPVDEAYVQVRLIRVPSRGPLRVALLVAGTAGLTMIAGSALSAAIGTSWLLLIPVSALLATFLVLLLRCWSVGTYVNDLAPISAAGPLTSSVGPRRMTWPNSRYNDGASSDSRTIARRWCRQGSRRGRL